MARAADGGSWTLLVARADPTSTRIVPTPTPEVGAGEALLRVDRVGLSSNNVTYAVLGTAFRYWEFFPAEPGWGVVPVWGFAEVVESRVDGLPAGARVYGFLPSAGHLLVRPGRIDARGFRDTSPHRSSLPAIYNGYVPTTGDPAYAPDQEDLLVLYRPLFWTSFILADWLVDHDAMGAQLIVLSSASSKTAYGTAFELRRQGRRVVGLTHQEAGPAGTLADPGPGMFFAPAQLEKRTAEEGREGLGRRFAAAWRAFAPVVRGWVDVRVEHGPAALERVWGELVAGRADPRTGSVVSV